MNNTSVNRKAAPALFSSFLFFSITTHAALVARDLDGNLSTVEAYYDDVLDITWLADANLAASNTFGVSGIQPASSTNPTRFPAGKMDWDTAENYIDAMNTYGGSGYLDIASWRQPAASGTCIDFGCGDQESDTDDELGYHYYQNFETEGQDIDPFYYGFPNSTTDIAISSLFTNIQSNRYWTGTESPSSSNHAFNFRFEQGYQLPSWKGNQYYVWPVASGDIGTSIVPAPAAAWLLCSALLGLAGVKRRARFKN